MIILDTNVISEIIKKQPDEHVANWLRNQDTSNLHVIVSNIVAGDFFSRAGDFFSDYGVIQTLR